MSEVRAFVSDLHPRQSGSATCSDHQVGLGYGLGRAVADLAFVAGE